DVVDPDISSPASSKVRLIAVERHDEVAVRDGGPLQATDSAGAHGFTSEMGWRSIPPMSLSFPRRFPGAVAALDDGCLG
ncbi:hypothetical protein K7G98_43160, partial [Saccharothrix sp. MB29]|nr:hypothetical protein [Saccharothrix sp. MB29]